MGMFGQLGDMYKLQKEAKKIKAELAKTHIFSEDGGVKVTVNGEQQIVRIEFLEGAPDDKEKLAKIITEACNKAMKKAQLVAAEKMKAVMGGFPGLGGGQ